MLNYNCMNLRYSFLLLYFLVLHHFIFYNARVSPYIGISGCYLLHNVINHAYKYVYKNLSFKYVNNRPDKKDKKAIEALLCLDL